MDQEKREWPADQVERRPIAALIPYARNPRVHSEAQIDQIAASIREWGWTVPILLDENDGVIAGHGRLLAAQKLGIETAPCMVARGWTEAQKRAYIIADNKLTLNADWDSDLLRIELGDLDAAGFDLDLTGFNEAELGDLMEPTGLSSGAGEGAGALSDRFMVPPFTVLNAREGRWQDRKRSWLALGIQSELGRGETEADASYKNQEALNALQAGRPHRKNAAPGGSLRPAADYSKGERGDGRGRAIRG